MGGAYLAAGGDTLAHALAGLAAQVAQARRRFDMAPGSPVRIIVAEDHAYDTDLVGRTVEIVPPAANRDWSGVAWPFVAAVQVHS